MDSKVKEKLETYHGLLKKWQPKINLISNNTLNNAWERHFEDSLQLVDLIPEESKTLFDLGSGAGFPGLVLAIARPDLEVHLVESDQKKCSFLKTVSRETEISVKIHNERIETVSRETIDNNVIPDVVTARALKSLKELFEFCDAWIGHNSNIALIFPKGERVEEELRELDWLGDISENFGIGFNEDSFDKNAPWKFTCRTYPSRIDSKSKILVFSNIYRM